MEVLENEFIHVLDTNDRNLENEINGLMFDDIAPSLVLGFISPHLSFELIAQKIKSYFQQVQK